MQMEASQFLVDAHRAMKSGQNGKARRLLQRAVSHNPHDFKAWLWLAYLTNVPQTRLDYIRRAEQLQPHHPAVAKARAWAARQQSPSRPNAATARKRWGQTAVTLTVASLCLTVLIFMGVFLLYWPTANDPATGTNGIAANISATAMPAATATPIPSLQPPQIAAKNVAANTQIESPRPTWTATPIPTATPSPTPTYYPTYVSENAYDVGVRPFGVAANERWIDIDLTAQTLIAYEGNNPAFITVVSSGIADHPTVTGMFRIWLRYESQTMDGTLLGYDYYLENVPYVMYFYHDYALHGTYWHNNFGNPMSHGCVNLSPDDARWLYEWSSLGTVVNVHY